MKASLWSQKKESFENLFSPKKQPDKDDAVIFSKSWKSQNNEQGKEEEETLEAETHLLMLKGNQGGETYLKWYNLATERKWSSGSLSPS